MLSVHPRFLFVMWGSCLPKHAFRACSA